MPYLITAFLQLIASLKPCQIDVYEWDEAKVTKRLPNHPKFKQLTTAKTPLTFTGLNLAHAVVKADFLDRCDLTLPGLGFLLNVVDILQWGTGDIKIVPNIQNVLNDFSLTSLAGRVGQGFTILYGQSLGYTFQCHLSTHVANTQPNLLPALKMHKAADFVFTDGNQTFLFESKGSFTLNTNDPKKIKAVLKAALEDQVDPWMALLANPPPTNGYAVYTCLRDGSADPSTICVVDPPGDESHPNDRRIPVSPETIMRENYAAWFRAMGLNNVASRLLGLKNVEVDPKPLQRLPVSIANIADEPYAFPYMSEKGAWHAKTVPAAGLHLDVFESITQWALDPGMSLVATLPRVDRHAFKSDSSEASVFPDGTCLHLNPDFFTEYDFNL